MRIYSNSNEAGAKQLSANSNEPPWTAIGGPCELPRKSPSLYIALRRMRIVIGFALEALPLTHARITYNDRKSNNAHDI